MFLVDFSPTPLVLCALLTDNFGSMFLRMRYFYIQHSHTIEGDYNRKDAFVNEEEKVLDK